jgi:predicted nucleic acid-binding protein
MPDSQRTIYWDSCVSLSYIDAVPDRIQVLDSLLDDCAKGLISLYTSDISRVEVAFAATEKEQRALDPETEGRIDSLWNDPKIFTMVEFHGGIAKEARALMRDAITRGWSLKPLDAVHLATAQWLSKTGLAIDEFHTYDTRLFRYGNIAGFKVIEPTILNPKLL